MVRKFILLLSLLDIVTSTNLVPRGVNDAASAKPRGVFTSVPPRETGRVGATSEYQSKLPPLIRERQYADQIPFNFCPEDFGKPPKLCDWCGGDAYQHGVCNNILLSGRQRYDCLNYGVGCYGYYCKCTHDGEDHNPQITSTTVVSCQTGTVIYEPLTLTQYSKLRSKTTVTLTDVATATTSAKDGESLETVLAVVFAGGITWLAVSESGGAAAIAAIKPPINKPEDAKNDDSSCKSNPKEECPNCGGSDRVGLCSSGEQGGCPCEEVQNCPNEPPRCSDAQCGGDDGQSQCWASGEMKGCTCCPDDPPLCSDKKCLGTNIQLCTAEKWDKCGCIVQADQADVEIEDEPSGITDPVALSSSISSVANYVFTAVWHANYSDVPGYPTPTQTSKPKPTSTTPEMGQVTCFPESRRPLDIYGPVNPDNYEKAVDKACAAFHKKDPKKPYPDDEMWSWLYKTKDGGTPYWFNVGWEDGCKLPGTDKQEQEMEDPLGGGSHTCEKIFKDDIFYHCNNGGRGGFIEAGCLVYAFEPCGDDKSGEGACFTTGRGAPWVVT
ncbi:hypothetical protein F5B20DRAFT_588095 [Whalleya microplaca]|nr:hypothetical protein F5B20DRAFT_588095 [Whalleya microplaca]